MMRFIERVRARAGKLGAWVRGHGRLVVALTASVAGAACLVLAVAFSTPAGTPDAATSSERGRAAIERPATEPGDNADSTPADGEKDGAEGAEETENGAASEDAADTATDGGNGSAAAPTSGGSAASGTSSASGSGATGSSGSSAGGGTGGTGSTPGQTSAPTHTHTWKDHTATKQVWVPNMVTVPDFETKRVAVGTTFIFAYDGYATTSVDDAKAHAVTLIRAGLPDNYRTEAIYETQTVQTGSHQEDQGHYETQSYVDYQYCDCGATR